MVVYIYQKNENASFCVSSAISCINLYYLDSFLFRVLVLDINFDSLSFY